MRYLFVLLVCFITNSFLLAQNESFITVFEEVDLKTNLVSTSHYLENDVLVKNDLNKTFPVDSEHLLLKLKVFGKVISTQIDYSYKEISPIAFLPCKGWDSQKADVFVFRIPDCKEMYFVVKVNKIETTLQK